MAKSIVVDHRDHFEFIKINYDKYNNKQLAFAWRKKKLSSNYFTRKTSFLLN